MRKGTILILELGGIGDVVMSLPAIEAVLAGRPDCGATILTVSRTKPIVESLRRKGLNNFEVVTTDAIEKRGLAGWLRVAGGLRSRGFETVIDLSVVETNKAAVKRWLFLKMLGAKETFGRDTDGRGWAFTQKASDSLTSSEHETERKMKVAGLFGVETTLAAPAIITSSEEREKAGALISGMLNGHGFIAGINPGAYRPSRMWPEERFGEIIKWLIEDMSAHVILTGGRGERGIVENLAGHFSDEKVRTIIDIPLMELAAVIEKMNIFITNDTGPMHIAAALNVPTVAIFGQTNLHRYHPYMDNSRYKALKTGCEICPHLTFSHPMQECRRFFCKGKECMNGITATEVKEAVLELL